MWYNKNVGRNKTTYKQLKIWRYWNELINEVVKSKGRRCTCIAYEVECDNCPFGNIDCTDKDLIYNIAKSLIKEDK